MSNNAIQEIFISHYENNNLPAYDQQRKAVSSICSCRTDVLGGIKTVCNNCNTEYYLYRSCGNRNCPRCQYIKQAKWVESRNSEVVDATYYHSVFTVPAELNDIFLHNQKECYNLLFQSVSQTLLTLASDSKRLNAKIGFICILHSWGSNLSYHPHLHVIIMGCGLNSLNKLVIPKGKFLFPVKAMSKLFRGKFLDGLRKLNVAQDVDYDTLYSKDWVVYLKDSVSGPDHVIEYLGRYTHRVAISNSRIVSYDDESVTFKYKDYRDGCKIKEMTLSTKEFTRRLLLHVLPKGFRKIRFYGLLSNRSKEYSLITLRKLLKSPKRVNRFRGKSSTDILKIQFGSKVCTCKNCGSTEFTTIPIPPKLSAC